MHVVDGVADRLQVLEVLVLDAEPDRALAELLLERLDQLDQRERVGVEVVDERLALGDRRRVDLEDVGEPVADDLEDLVAIEWGLLTRSRQARARESYVPAPVSVTIDERSAPGVGGDGGADLVDHVGLDHLPGDADAVDDRRLARRTVADDADAVDAEQHRAAVGVGARATRRAASSAGISASACGL